MGCVDDIAKAVAYYERVFGFRERWRDSLSVGLGFPVTDAEIVIHSNFDLPHRVEVHYLVDDVEAFVVHVEQNGSRIVVPPFEIVIGKCAVIEDPFGITMCVLDMTKGPRKKAPSS
jgi:predicted enzyme related to lactoylglutathione lyase